MLAWQSARTARSCLGRAQHLVWPAGFWEAAHGGFRVLRTELRCNAIRKHGARGRRVVELKGFGLASFGMGTLLRPQWIELACRGTAGCGSFCWAFRAVDGMRVRLARQRNSTRGHSGGVRYCQGCNQAFQWHKFSLLWLRVPIVLPLSTKSIHLDPQCPKHM